MAVLHEDESMTIDEVRNYFPVDPGKTFDDLLNYLDTAGAA